MPPRGVADSNVIISALHAGGKPEAVLSLAQRGEIELSSPTCLTTASLSVPSPAAPGTSSPVEEEPAPEAEEPEGHQHGKVGSRAASQAGQENPPHAHELAIY